ncbi:hypothetical protein [Leptospira kirschneri]|uniref:Uncharacterized protein n=1 Tax=Leptospira kirschneri serovar Bulgarica str. Nikolaevo TaxID=1240687 RepID=M6FBM1_9LEPT|nr:hypothetical protein [Leptospira kirschneri]EKO62365.1 hypothetical protein LEP1GSC082_4281 [Leptospira kirschneri str. H2]EMK24427.1 hypothetical protein LEP1GSC008_3910 [Leptospira kirschneri serovar Bulgarica str. Nikolaevo]
MKLLSFKKFFLTLTRTLTLVGIVSGSLLASGLNLNTQLPIKECFTNEITSSELSNLYKSILPLEEKKRIAETIAYKEGKSRYRSIICIQNKNLSEEDHSKLFMDWNRHIFMYAELNSYYENYILSDEKTRSLNSIEWELLTTHLKQKKELLTRLNDATGFALNGEKISEENFSMIYLSLFLLQVEFWDAMPKTFRDSIL